MDIQKGTVVIIEDSPTVRYMLKNEFESLGYEVLGMGEDRDSTYDLFDYFIEKQFSPEIVTVDLVIPGIDSKELVNYIRFVHESSKIAIITAFGDETAKREYTALKTDFFFEKPVNREQISKLIEAKPVAS